MIKSVITQEVNKEGKIIHRIRSFVRRRARLTLYQKNTLQMLWPAMGIDFTEQPISFKKIFGNNAPVILEIGFGIGKSLVVMAEQNIKKNFLGIEVYTPGISACLLSAKKAKITNLRVIFHDALEVLDKMLLDSSLSIVQLFFPDPWHKVRHNKRRIVQAHFSNLVLHKLELGGMFYIATDCRSYAEHILNVMRKISDYQNLSLFNDYVKRPDWRPVTKFEKHGKELGNEVFDLAFKKIR
ncbi:MAG: tRNA (guanosine(46)-N7)-methyltransferase TrmB [Arsenophonus sp.]